MKFKPILRRNKTPNLLIIDKSKGVKSQLN